MAVARLRDFAIVLPDPAPVNVNTAPAEVLAAVAGVSLSEGNALVAARKTAYWPTPAQFDAAHRTGGRRTTRGKQSRYQRAERADCINSWLARVAQHEYLNGPKLAH